MGSVGSKNNLFEKSVLINTDDNGIVDMSLYPVKSWVKDLIKNRQFDSIEEVQNLLRVVDISQDAYDRGLGAPVDAKNALEKIKSAPKVEFKTDVIKSYNSGRDVYDEVRKLYKQGDILYYSNVIDPTDSRKYWMVEVITNIKKRKK